VRGGSWPAPPVGPVWAGPPWHVRPGIAGLSVELGHSDSTVVLLEGAAAYEQGVVLNLVVRVRETDADEWRRVLRGFSMVDGREVRSVMTPPGLSWAVEYPDGRCVSTEDESPWAAGPPDGASDATWIPDQPVLEAVAVPPSTFSDRWSREVWLWPLPPAGPLRFTCSWPERGIRTTTVVLDVGTALLEAAAAAKPLWEGHQGSPRRLVERADGPRTHSVQLSSPGP
jgi:hypothetical protein